MTGDSLNYELILKVDSDFSGLYYKLMTIVSDDSRVVNKLEASLIDDARVVIYDRHMFIVEATRFCLSFSDILKKAF